ncbi:thioesterase family protein [Helicobacter sp. 13S00477-4]|uniref:acyl-CoA thioesterase n=1 Tax=Helicobacter sp. 13S00477-4 TaxID=1905759 RepID=UPI000BA6F181|nr:thioesterase family protein [Helicobacter sp. 13S00477-4]PAF52518.1 hypothetical protein BKH44_01685 [Helicobacter sp. 13S00477-4]
MKIKIYYEDTDCGGIVYHTNYIKYCERARSEKFFSLGLRPYENSNGFVVHSLEAHFLGSATLGDEIDVSTQVIQVKNVSILLKQEIHKNQNKIFEMEIKLGYINLKTHIPTPIPKHFLEVLNAK